MLMLFVSSVICIFFVFIDLIPMFKQDNAKLICAYIALMAFYDIISIMMSFRVRIPSPAIPLEKAVMGFLELFK